MAALQLRIADLDGAIAETTSALDLAATAKADEILNQRQLAKDVARSEQNIKALQKDVHRLNGDIAAAQQRQQQQQQAAAPGPASVPPLDCHAVYTDENGDGTAEVELVCD